MARLTTFLLIIVLIEFQGKAQNIFGGWEHLFHRGIPLISWNAERFRSAVFLDGTLNQPIDTDKSWTIEMAIPFHDLRLGVHAQKPENGTHWRVGFIKISYICARKNKY